MKKIADIHNLLTNNDFSEKIQLVFATKVASEDYDNYEKNYTYTNLAPKTIRAIVRTITSEALVWKQYGLKEIGAIEIITDAKYKSWFEKCSEVIYDKDKYSVYRDGSSTRAIIEKKPNNLIRVILQKR
jgi:hypothetical protein